MGGTAQRGRRDGGGSRVAWLGLAACLLVYLGASLLCYDQIEEDAYIYFRVAENLASGHGYVFNRGDAPVESGTSPLWQLLVVALVLLPLPLVTGAKLLGIAFGALSLVLTARLSARFVSDPLARLAPVLLLAVSVPFVLWSQRGLETPLFAASVLWTTLALSAPVPSRLWVVPAAGMFLARPEGAYLLLAVVPFLAAHRERFAELARPGLALVALGAAASAARLAYFHDLVPHSFYVKMDADDARNLVATHSYFAASHLYAFLIPLLACLPRRSFWTRERALLLSMLALLIGWSLMAAAEFKPAFRHVVPLLPVCYVACVCGFEALLGTGTPVRRGLLRALCLGFVLVVGAAPETPWLRGSSVPNPIGQALGRFLGQPSEFAAATWTKIVSPSASTWLDAENAESIGHSYQALIGKFLALNYPEGTRIVYDQMGQTPYFAGPGVVFLDSFGITDRFSGYLQFASRAERSLLLRAYQQLFFGGVVPLLGLDSGPRSPGAALDHVFAWDPDLILIHRFVGRIPASLPARIGADERLRRGYLLRAELAGLVLLYEKVGSRTPRFELAPGLSIREH